MSPTADAAAVSSTARRGSVTRSASSPSVSLIAPRYDRDALAARASLSRYARRVSQRTRALALFAACGFAAACSSSSDTTKPAPSPPATCALDETRLDDGTCQPPGVPPAMCGAGFVADGRGGCGAVLPKDACPSGQMAVPGDAACRAVGAPDAPSCLPGLAATPGESACHELADCGNAPWGNIPVDATTQYVDASYPGAISDGTAGKPWKTIAAAVGAAASGALVAVAAGSYHENVVIQGKAARLWGRCPNLVEIVASGGLAGAAIGITGAATAGTETHQLALTGDAQGVALSATKGIALERMWIHDTSQDGLVASGDFALRASLVERSHTTGLQLTGGHATVDTTVFRDVQSRSSDGLFGVGIGVLSGATLALTSSVFDRCHGAGLVVIGSDAVAERSIFRGTLPQDVDQSAGWGVEVGNSGSTSVRRGSVTVRASTLEGGRDFGVLVNGADGVVEGTLVRDTLSQAKTKLGGIGIQVQLDAVSSHQRGSLVVRGSLIERSRVVGIAAVGGDLEVDGSAVRDTLPGDADQPPGVGVGIKGSPLADGARHLRAKVTVRGSLLERNRSAGLGLLDSDGVLESTVIRDTLPNAVSGAFGIGVVVVSPTAIGGQSTLSVRSSVITGNRTIGILADTSDLTVEASVVSGTLPQASDQSFGYGIDVQLAPPGSGQPTPTVRPRLVLRSSLIADNRTIGVVVSQADATIASTAIRGTQPRARDGAFGDGVEAELGANVSMSASRVEGSPRAGVSAFSAHVTLDGVGLVCNAIPLDAEASLDGVAASFDLSSGGGDHAAACSCGASSARCQVLSSGLTAPEPIVPL